MKTTVIAGILFLLVLVFLGVNFYVLNSIFDETLALFSTLPVSKEALEQASEEEIAAAEAEAEAEVIEDEPETNEEE